MRIVFCVILLNLKLVTAVAQKNDSVDIYKKKALSAIRMLGDSTDPLRNIPVKDSFAVSLAKMIILVRGCDDLNQLRGLSGYFLNINTSLSRSADKMQILKGAYRDITLKLDYRDSGLVLGWDPTNSFFKDCDVTVYYHITPEVHQPGLYRAYWATYVGEDPLKMIRSSSSEGASRSLANPCVLRIKLPGYITFWLENTSTGKFYRSDFTFIKMYRNQKTLEVNFLQIP